MAEATARIFNEDGRTLISQLHKGFYLLQSSSASRFTAGALGFLLLIQCGERPKRGCNVSFRWQQT